MFDFTARQIRRLTDMAGGGKQTGAGARMVNALLSSEVDEKLEPLRNTLQLSEMEFREGVFSWRGFLYYKWSLEEFWPSLMRSLRQLKVIKYMGQADHEQKVYITGTRETIIRGAKRCSDDIRTILGVYDSAYDQPGDQKRRQAVPRIPAECARRCSWRSARRWARCPTSPASGTTAFPENVTTLVDAEELTTIFRDFSNSFVAEKQAA